MVAEADALQQRLIDQTAEGEVLEIGSGEGSCASPNRSPGLAGAPVEGRDFRFDLPHEGGVRTRRRHRLRRPIGRGKHPALAS